MECEGEGDDVGTVNPCQHTQGECTRAASLASTRSVADP